MSEHQMDIEEAIMKSMASALDNLLPSDGPLRGQLRTARIIKEFATAGCATFTIRSRVTHTRYTYKVQAPRHGTEVERAARRQRPIWFVKVMTGPDNESSFEYMGLIRENMEYEHGRANKTRVGPQAPSAQAFRWFWNAVVRPERDDLMPQLEVWHEGRCGRCGRKLTVPESVESGYGPECINMMRGRVD